MKTIAMLGSRGPESDRSRAIHDFSLSYRRLRETGEMPPRWVAKPTFTKPVMGSDNKPIVDITLAPLPGPDPKVKHGPIVYDSLEEFLGHEPQGIVRKRQAQKQDQAPGRGWVRNLRLAGASLLAGIGR